ncbi:MAG: transposase [Desulfobulbus sp.]|nr:transposase [Desulfobulbus sp.]
MIQRGNNRHPCFYTDEDYIFYLEWLHEYSRESGCAIHAYVLMTNHVHLLLTPKQATGIGLLMKRLGQRYVQYVNRSYQRSGTLWEGRFRSCLTQEETYLLTCQRYIEMNPVRAGMVKAPHEYRWSSFRANALGEPNPLLTQHSNYQSLGTTQENRQQVYRELFRQELDPGIIDSIRKATNGNFVLGSERFSEEISQVLGRRVTPGKAGRPSKSS